MPSLNQLRNKWFLTFDSSNDFPPKLRHNGTTVSDYTDGNVVTPLIDGQNYMREWHDSIRSMIGQSNCEIYHAAWRLEGVRTLGHSTPNSDALETLNDADNGNVIVYPLTDRNLLTVTINNLTVIWLRLHGIFNAVMDNRFPPGGSNHQKFVCLKNPLNPKVILGSIDISKTRWDRSAHNDIDSERNPDHGKPTHDTGVMIQGPAVTDVERTFRERWNDSTRTLGLEPLAPPLPRITTSLSSPSATGTHSIQILHTYGITNRAFGYSWSPRGEFTVWASYLNAIKNATNYIYIEDQYFLPFDWPPCHTRGGLARESDIIYQLGEAIKRGVKVAVLVPNNAEDSTHIYQKYQRDIGANYLAGIANTNSGDFVIAYLHNGTSPVYVHSKLMICDDEFVAIGSANIGQRSMTYDSELHVGIVDSANQFAREFRKKLWSEHLSRPESALNDPITAYTTFKNDTTSGSGKVRSYSTSHPGAHPIGHPTTMRSIVDPYGGPPR